MSNISGSSPSVKSKTVYRVKNWSSYNRALVARGSLTVWLDDGLWKQWYAQGPSQRGAQFVYSDRTIEWILTMRVLLGLPLRQTQGFIQSLLGLMPLALAVPDYSTLSRRQGALAVVLPKKQTDSPDSPMHLVVDSTGLKVYGEGEWKVRQHGWTKRRTWRKLHVGVNEATGEVVAQTLTSHRIDDASQMIPLLTQVDEGVGAVGGDGAYDKRKVFDALATPSSGPSIRPIIALRKDATIQQHGNCKAPRWRAMKSFEPCDEQDARGGNRPVAIIDARWPKRKSIAISTSSATSSRRVAGSTNRSKVASAVPSSIE